MSAGTTPSAESRNPTPAEGAAAATQSPVIALAPLVESPNEPLPPAAFGIVGIGASAGGLDAVRALLDRLPADTGMAYLLVQHLDPDHPSLLSHILAGHTAMHVQEAIDGNAVAPGNVYVIPPNTVMTVAEGRLRLGRRSELGPPMPIDDLFDSLAESAPTRAIGVLLSGGGSDGALGMQAIKRAGGVTLAQDPTSAAFASMPRSAIDLGCVDVVQPPAGLADHLVRLAERLAVAAPESAAGLPASNDGEWARIFARLRECCGIDFTHYKSGTVQRRLDRRMALRNADTLSDYLAMLEREPAEAQALCQDLLIRVTSFFRDPLAFRTLIELVLPRLVAGRSPGNPLRIWVPACSTGEEVYSIAICVLEHLGARANSTTVQIFGTDVSDTVVRTARTGRYIENIARDVSAERLARFFVRDGSYYRVLPAVRDICVFATHDVTRDPPFSRIDLVSCRNLLIYLDPVLQKRVLPIFHYALNPGGVLMLGASESIGAAPDQFLVLDAPSKVYISTGRSRPPHAAAGDRAALFRSAGQPAGAGPVLAPTDRDRVKHEADRVALERFMPPSVLCTDALEIEEFRGDTSPYLAHKAGPSNLQLTALARPDLAVRLSNLIRRARASGVAEREPEVRIADDGGTRTVTLDVVPVHAGAETGRRWLISFTATAARSATPLPDPAPLWHRLLGVSGRGVDIERRIPADAALLAAELAAAREHIRALGDEHDFARAELQASREELLSSNEEFQSTNEELQTAKEELQSTNEELATTNDELRHRNSELAETNIRLSESRDYADAIVETIREPLLVLDSTLRVRRANAAYYRGFRASPAETEGRDVFSIGNLKWDSPQLRDMLARVLSQDNTIQDFELAQHFADLGPRVLRLNARRLRWTDHTLILLAMEDVTEQEAALALLKDGERRKDEFLAMLGHELRSPLAPMLSVVELWQRGFAGAGDEGRARGVLQRQVEKQGRLVDDLLDVARVTHGLVTLQRSRVDLNEVVANAVEGMRGPLAAFGDRFVLAHTDDPLWMDADAIRLGQVVTNLVGNAIKYNRPEGTINVSVSRSGDDALLVVADTGIGMAPELLPRVFDLFVQSDRALDRAQGGMGIGLALVRRVCELHGGEVTAASAGIDRGSVLKVRLPLAGAGFAAPLVTAVDSPHHAPRRRRSILVVDDNTDTAETCAALLRLSGDEVRTAGDGLHAIELAIAAPPDIVLLDIGLPGMSGYEVAQRLRALTGLQRARIIALSGYGQPEDVRRSWEAGIDVHLTKPTSFELLQQAIDG